jgi:hypothetical protein
MAFHNKIFRVTVLAIRSVAALVVFGCFAAAPAPAVVNFPGPRFSALASDLSADSLTLIAQSPLVAGGQTVGAIAVYDDPATHRPADYLEVVDNQGSLVAVSWFDRFGIERLMIDRALIEGGNQLKGEFVAVLDGESV